MGDAAKKVYDEAMKLPVAERERLAADLYDSLPGDVVLAWEEELRRRMDDARAGRSSWRTWDDVEADLRTQHARK